MSSRGFTLIEVLVALVIVAVGMSALMGALTSSAKAVTYMQDRTFAEWVALNQIESVRIAIQAPGQLPALGKTNGDVDFANRKWHWAQEIVQSSVPGIVRIDVKARPKEVGSGSDDDNANWYVTVSGVAGSAMAAPGSFLWPWINIGSPATQQNAANGNNPGSKLQNGQPNGSNGQNTSLNSNPNGGGLGTPNTNSTPTTPQTGPVRQ